MRRKIPFRTILIMGIGLILCAQTSFAEVTTQTIHLSNGWNLISIQVALPDPSTAAFCDRFPGILSIWGWNAAGKYWRSYRPGFPDLNGLGERTLSVIEPNCGYWIETGKEGDLVCAGTIAPGGMTLYPGWNLVGFPGLRRAELEVNDIASVFGDANRLVKQIWTFDSSPTAQSFAGYDTASNPPLYDIYDLQPGGGYWVFVEETATSVSLAPAARLLVPQDYDMPSTATGELNPLAPFDPEDLDPNNTGVNVAGFDYARYAGSEVRWRGPEDLDQDLNGNGILDSSETQDTILMGKSVSQVTLTVVNNGRGVTGYAVASSQPWLVVDNSTGSISSEQDLVRLTVLRDNLPEGEYAGTLTFTTDEGYAKAFRVTMEVADMSGDYKGKAVVKKINGQNIDTLPAIDLYLSLYKTKSSANGDEHNKLQGVVSSEESLLFPVDFDLDGFNFITDSNAFAVAGGYILPLTAQNYPPYDTFDTSKEDFELDDEGNRVTTVSPKGNINPFPFQLSRSVFLNGSRPHYDQLTGEYFETIRNAIKDEPIFLEGTFTLDRVSHEITQREPRAIPPVVETRTIPDDGSIVITRTVEEAIGIQSLATVIKVMHQRPTDLKITMVAPAEAGKPPVSVVLFDTTKDNPPSANIERSWSFDSIEGTGWVQDLAEGANRKDNHLELFVDVNSYGQWTLIIEDTKPGEVGQFISWELRVGGKPAYILAGTVREFSSVTPIAGADVFLSGSQGTRYIRTVGNGRFLFENLPPQTHAITVQKAGYETYHKEIAVLEPYSEMSVELQRVERGDDEADFDLLPTSGQAPLTLTAVARIGSDYTSGTFESYRWHLETYPERHPIQIPVYSFDPAVTLTFPEPGAYHVWLEYYDYQTTRILTVPATITPQTARLVLVYPRADGKLPAGLYAFDPAFSGGGAAFLWQRVSGSETSVRKLHGVVLNENFADMANFDINRPLFALKEFEFTQIGLDTDFGILRNNHSPFDLKQSGVPGQSDLPDPDVGFQRRGSQDRDGRETPSDDPRRLRMVVNMGGPLNGFSAAGEFQLRIGGTP